AAARDLIRSNGVEGMSISQVVATSGTSTGAIYHHFGNKERLVLAVGKSAIAEPMTMVMRTTPGISPAGLLEAALLRVAADERMPTTLLQIWSGAQSNAELADLLAEETTLMRTSVEAFITPWVRENAPSVGVDEVVTLLFGLVAGYAVQRALGLGVDAQTYRRTAVGALQTLTAADEAGDPSVR
ncbi:MAG: TetR/AcrR family transcriptional regulator, partial [Propioniciclava sp.]